MSRFFEFEYVEKIAVCGCLVFSIKGFFAIESVLYVGPPGGGIDIELSLFPNDALEGELESCDEADLKGDCLLVPAWGGLSIIFLLDEAFLIGRRGESFWEFEETMDGIGA